MEEKCPMTESPPTTPSLTSGGRFNKIEHSTIYNQVIYIDEKN